MLKKYIKSTCVLVCICAVVAIMMAITNAITAPLIEENEKAAANEALLLVMPNGQNFERMDIGSYALPATVKEVYKEVGGGYVFKLNTTGYSSGFVIMCGVNADGTVSGALCLSSTETLGYEKTYGNAFLGKDIVSLDTVDTVSGATKTTGAYRSAVMDALTAAKTLRDSASAATEEGSVKS